MPEPIDDPTAPKAWWQSKTVWLNGVLTVIGVSTFFAEPRNDPALTVASVSAAVAGAAGVVLRVWFTSAPIAGTRRAQRALAAQAERVGRAILHTAPGGRA